MLLCTEETGSLVGKFLFFLLFSPDLDFSVDTYLIPISTSLLVTRLRSTIVH